MSASKKYTASEIARERLEKHIAKIFNVAGIWDEVKWEFYSFLLEEAESHKLDFSGFTSEECKRDIAEAKRRNDAIPDPQGIFIKRH